MFFFFANLNRQSECEYYSPQIIVLHGKAQKDPNFLATLLLF